LRNGIFTQFYRIYFHFSFIGLLDNNSNSSTLEGEEDSLAGMNKTVGSPKLRLPSVTSPNGSKASR
jgi:hypothetical protein